MPGVSNQEATTPSASLGNNMQSRIDIPPKTLSADPSLQNSARDQTTMCRRLLLCALVN